MEARYLAVVVWSRLHGLAMFEVNGQSPAFITDSEEVFRREVKSFISHFLMTK